MALSLQIPYSILNLGSQLTKRRDEGTSKCIIFISFLGFPDPQEPSEDRGYFNAFHSPINHLDDDGTIGRIRILICTTTVTL